MSRISLVPARLASMEVAHVINSTTNLIGISTSPKADASSNQSIIAILLNAGYLHHVGPNRLNTTLARSLAASGVTSMRLDFSGLGDSGANHDIHDNAELVIHDAKTVMDYCEAHFGANQFVLFGLCSGALDSIHIAQNDERVVGFVAVDGLGFRTWKFYIYHFCIHMLPRLFQLKHLRRGFSRGLGRGAQIVRKPLFRLSKSTHALADDGSLTNKSRHEISHLLQNMSDQNRKMRFIFTGGASHFYNYANQFADMFDSLIKRDGAAKHVSWKYFPQADHLFMLQSHRDAFLDDVEKWILDEFTTD